MVLRGMWRIWYGIGWTKMICSSSSDRYYSDKSRQNTTQDENISSNNEVRYRCNRTTLRNTIDWTIQRTIKHTRRTQLWRIYGNERGYNSWKISLLDENIDRSLFKFELEFHLIQISKLNRGEWACLFLLMWERSRFSREKVFLPS